MSLKRSGDTGARQPSFRTTLFSFQSVPLPFDSTPKSNCNEFFAITSGKSFPLADNLSRFGGCAEATTVKQNGGSRNAPFLREEPKRLKVVKALRDALKMFEE